MSSSSSSSSYSFLYTIPISTPTPPAPTVTLPLHRITLIAYCYILPVVCVIGIIGNITNLITLASRRLKAVSYMYLRALAIADLLCMIFVLIFASGEIIQRAGVPLNQFPVYGIYQAHLMLTLINWALATGVLIVVALSLERFISIAFPIHFRAWNSPQRAIKAILACYSLSAILYIPYGIGRYTMARRIMANDAVAYITVDSEVSKTLHWQIYKWTREGILRFAPIILVSILNVQIMTAFRRRRKMFARLTKRKSSGTGKDDTLVYMLGGIVAMFFICNIPAAINLLFINETVKQRLDYQIFRAVANLLEITNHASQFYVFCACSTDYRITFMRKFPCFRSNCEKGTGLKSYVWRTNTAVETSKYIDDVDACSSETERKMITNDEYVSRKLQTVNIPQDRKNSHETESLLEPQNTVEKTDSNGMTFL